MLDTTLDEQLSDNTTLKQETPPYWRSYNLKQPPFADAAPYAMYYPIAQWQAHLEFLRNFCNSTHPVALIEGELGIGKTTLLTQYLATLDETLVVYQLQGRSTLNAEQLLFHLAQIFPIPLTQTTLPEQLQAFYGILQQQQKTCLLVIDDADLLPTETLAAVARLATLQNPQRLHLYILLTSELNLTQQIENLAEEQGDLLRIPNVIVQPLNLDQTRNYLKHRLLKAGLTGRFPFSTKMIESIYELSSGVPARINRVAQQQMLDLLSPKPQQRPAATITKPAKATNHSSFLRKYPLLSVGITVVLLSFVFWRFPSTSHTTQQTVATALQLAPASHELATTTPTPAKKPLHIAAKPHAHAVEQTTQQALQKIMPHAATTTVAIAPVVKPAAIKNEVSFPPLLPENSAKAKQIVLPKHPTIKTQTTPAKVALAPPLFAIKQPPKVANKVVLPAAYALDEKDLLRFNGYTVQLLGSRNPDDLQVLMAKYQYVPGAFLRFATKFDGKPWYVLVYGHYADETQAKAAIAKLPKELQKLNPWIRPLASVQDAMKQQ